MIDSNTITNYDSYKIRIIFLAKYLSLAEVVEFLLSIFCMIALKTTSISKHVCHRLGDPDTIIDLIRPYM